MKFLILFLPLIYLFFNSQTNENIINISSYLIINTGHLLLIYLLVILIVPLTEQTGKLIDRRSLGITTFVYAVVHFLLYVFDNNIDLSIMIDDLKYREYIQTGSIALLLFFPLVLTSNQISKTLLQKKWINLHKIIYAIIFLSLYHYYLIIKADYLIFWIYILLFTSVISLKYIKSVKNE